jgi:response regulator NasT
MPASDLSILVLDEDRSRAALIRDGLIEAGHSRVTVVAEVQGLARRIEDINPDVIVIDVRNPNRDLVKHLFQLSRAARRPVAMFVDRSDAAMMEAAIDAGVSAYVVDGLRKDRVKGILDMAVARFNANAALRGELEEARQALADRKTLDRAKMILMRARGIGEDEAHHLIRRTAMRENRRMTDVACSIVTAANMILGEE